MTSLRLQDISLIYKTQVYIYVLTMKNTKLIIKIFSLKLTLKRLKYSRIDVTQWCKYTENYKTSSKNEGISKQKDTCL